MLSSCHASEVGVLLWALELRLQKSAEMQFEFFVPITFLERLKPQPQPCIPSALHSLYSIICYCRQFPLKSVHSSFSTLCSSLKCEVWHWTKL